MSKTFKVWITKKIFFAEKIDKAAQADFRSGVSGLILSPLDGLMGIIRNDFIFKDRLTDLEKRRFKKAAEHMATFFRDYS